MALADRGGAGHAEAMSTNLRPLTTDECIDLLAHESVGRLAVVHDGYPVIVPVNYRLVERDRRPTIVLRTRARNALDVVGEAVGFEIDGLAPDRRSGWSVLVRGVLHSIEPDEANDPDPAVGDDRTAWRAIVPWSITGRRVRADPAPWPFVSDGYL